MKLPTSLLQPYAGLLFISGFPGHHAFLKSFAFSSSASSLASAPCPSSPIVSSSAVFLDDGRFRP